MGDLVLVPKKYRCLSGSGLKILAIVTMVIDHIGATFPRSTASVMLHIGQKRLMLYTVMRFIGRLSFPIFAFLLVEGFLHTRDRERYGIRLAVFAILSELPWNLLHADAWRYETQNVFFTLLLGYLGLCLIERIQKEVICSVFRPESGLRQQRFWFHPDAVSAQSTAAFSGSGRSLFSNQPLAGRAGFLPDWVV